MRVHELKIANVIVAFVVAMSFFLRLRLFDEIKDYETDLTVNPTRPLARGLIKIPEVRKLIGLLCLLEFGLLACISKSVALAHILPVAYSFLMYREFFIGKWIRPHLTTYAVLHTFVSVLVGASIVAIITGVPFPHFTKSLWWLVLANWGYFNLFEFARKTFAPSEERAGVESYSKIFGIPGAVILSLSQAVFPLFIVQELLGRTFFRHDVILLWGLLVIVVGPSLGFVIRRRDFAAKMFRNLVGLYLILGYLGLAWVLGS